MTFADGTAEARVQARYAQYGSQEEFGREMQRQERLARDIRAKLAADREHYVVNNGVRHDVPATHIHRATPKAVDYLVALSIERFPAVTEESIRAWADGVHYSEVSAKIDWLKTQPKVVNSGVGTTAYAHIPAGRYAVTGDHGQTVFVKVVRPTEGQWAGRVFVNIQAGDELHQVSATTRNALLAKIEGAGVRAASTRYGREIGSCGVCGRTLTDAESRDAGIGPVCRAKMGW